MRSYASLIRSQIVGWAFFCAGLVAACGGDDDDEQKTKASSDECPEGEASCEELDPCTVTYDSCMEQALGVLETCWWGLDVAEHNQCTGSGASLACDFNYDDDADECSRPYEECFPPEPVSAEVEALLAELDCKNVCRKAAYDCFYAANDAGCTLSGRADCESQLNVCEAVCEGDFVGDGDTAGDGDGDGDGTPVLPCTEGGPCADAGEDCTSHDDCQSGECSGKDGVGWCKELCNDESDCPVGTVCEWEGRDFYCSIACSTDGDCATAFNGEFVCENSVCTRPLSAGELCERHTECISDHCTGYEGLGWCHAPCDSLPDGCPEGTVCTTSAGGTDYCFASCTTTEECATRFNPEFECLDGVCQ